MSERKDNCKTLSEMSLCELIKEKKFLEAMRYAYDRDNQKMHESLASNINIVKSRIEALLSEKPEEDKE
jgi:hypothetical protein